MTYSDVCAAVLVIEILVFQQLSVSDVWEAACKSRLAAGTDDFALQLLNMVLVSKLRAQKPMMK